MPKPSESLLGLTLQNDWMVIEELVRHPNSTGGHFSSGYKVQRDESTAYLKALDFSVAFEDSDPARKLQNLLEAYNFERDLLQKCKERRLTKIVTPIDDGSVDAPGFPQILGKVYYIIFNLADGDIRKVKDTFHNIDLSFTFRALHNTAVGLQQLHNSGIAHQDLKPSNIMVFQNDYKIGDLGRSSAIEKPFWYDSYAIPGDVNYCPIEQRYGFHFTDDFGEKYAADLYLFGSLFYFFFSGLSASQVLLDNARKLKIALTDNFETDIPEWERAFSESLLDLTNTLKTFLPDRETSDIVSLVKYLCNPDPRKRGFLKNIETNVNQYSLERFISRLDILAKKAEYGML